ncbi:hypothetical protein [Phytoactinopolyspora halotolerans]|uniref:hypothetical protein n=1 Tax=Phytoactinopolyspora halotolerans TaxID=1981512 RepID=UPI001FECFD01|nr:hypothetical protein [Phytoactinopolyspora halotolerans]
MRWPAAPLFGQPQLDVLVLQLQQLDVLQDEQLDVLHEELLAAMSMDGSASSSTSNVTASRSTSSRFRALFDMLVHLLVDLL